MTLIIFHVIKYQLGKGARLQLKLEERYRLDKILSVIILSNRPGSALPVFVVHFEERNMQNWCLTMLDRGIIFD